MRLTLGYRVWSFTLISAVIIKYLKNRAFLVAQMVKSLPAMPETWV